MVAFRIEIMAGQQSRLNRGSRWWHVALAAVAILAGTYLFIAGNTNFQEEERWRAYWATVLLYLPFLFLFARPRGRLHRLLAISFLIRVALTVAATVAFVGYIELIRRTFAITNDAHVLPLPPVIVVIFSLWTWAAHDEYMAYLETQEKLLDPGVIAATKWDPMSGVLHDPVNDERKP